jgi:hypothetical protein
MRKVVGQLAGQLEDMRSENGGEHVAIGEIARANDQLRAEAAQLKERIQVLEQENRRIAEANEVVKRDIGPVSNCCPKVKKDLIKIHLFGDFLVANLVQRYWLGPPCRFVPKMKKDLIKSRPFGDLAVPNLVLVLALGPLPDGERGLDESGAGCYEAE